MRQLQRRDALGVLLVEFGLIALSAVVQSPVTDAAPNLFAGTVVVVVAWKLVERFGVDRTLSTVTAPALAIGGLVAIYEGISVLLQIGVPRGVAVAGELVLLVGLVLFVYDWQFVR
jgi:hypothetical protein